MKKDKKIRHSTASYTQPDGEPVCCVDELAKTYAKSIGNIPERLGFTKAAEVNLLAAAYLHQKKTIRLLEKKINNS